ncbi:nitroreductase family protein [Paenibacillus elgii]|uniref:nitroreductase family protein n=1 Tax=Paenibacillus elgii TaxID=189691 RepID=UPI000248CA95|nr:nitroreductase family protein [Paenibacillus elgii]
MRFEPYRIVTDLIEDTKTALPKQAFSEIPSALLGRGEARSLGVPSVVPLREGSPVYRAIEAREALRHWSDRPVAQADLLTILHSAYQGDAADWREEHEAGLDIGLVVYVSNVENVTPALYRYCPYRQELERAGAMEPGKLEHMVLQREFSLAPAIVVITGKLGAVLCRQGSSGHRQLLVRGGMAAQRMWLASLALGYGGCIFAGIVQKYLYETAKIDGYREMQLVAYAFGNLPQERG